jgi:hypothetical protein
MFYAANLWRGFVSAAHMPAVTRVAPQPIASAETVNGRQDFILETLSTLEVQLIVAEAREELPYQCADRDVSLVRLPPRSPIDLIRQ